MHIIYTVLRTPLILFGILYFIFVLAMYMFQDKFLYFPKGGYPESSIQYGLKPWPTINNYLGFVSINAPKESLGTFLIWHGNAGSALDRAFYTQALELRGFRVVLIEYPGYGTREGKKDESSFISDAKRITDLVLDHFNEPIYIIGESMGCAIATAMAGQFTDEIKGVVLITPWADLPALAQAKYWFLPAKWLTRDKFDNISNLHNYAGPVAILMAGKDEIVPNRHTMRLFNAIHAPKRLGLFEAAGHNAWPVHPKAKWWDEMIDFIHSDS